MNYTQTIRDYCLQNTGKVFDVSYEHKRYFDMVPYKIFSKIVGRLEEEGTLKLYSKGIFLIAKNQNEDDPIISFYASNDTGMVVGYDLYNKLEVKSTSGSREIFNMPSGEIKFMKEYKDNYILILVTDVNSEFPKTKKYTCDQILSLGKEYPSIRFYGWFSKGGKIYADEKNSNFI